MDWEFFRIIPAIAWEGMRMWAGPPRFAKLKFDSVSKWNKYLVINLKHWKSDYDYWADSRICIDPERKLIDYHASTGWLFGYEHAGSAALAVAIFSFPLCLPLSPALLSIRGAYRLSEEMNKRSRHAARLLVMLEGQLPDDAEKLLREAIKNTWLHTKDMTRKVTFEEARDFLKTCNVKRSNISPDDPDVPSAYNRDYHWVNAEGDNVGTGNFSGPFDRDVRVLGSHFVADEAEELAECYNSIEHINRNEDHNPLEEA